MIDLVFPKLYRYPRVSEPCQVAVPLKKGVLKDVSKITVYQKDQAVPSQAKVTSHYPDGSARYLFLRFEAGLPANAGTTLQCDLTAKKQPVFDGIHWNIGEDSIEVDCKAIRFSVENNSQHLFQEFWYGKTLYNAKQWQGPYLTDGDGQSYGIKLHEWKLKEAGPVCVILKANGECLGHKSITFEIQVTAYHNKPWIEISYTLMNTTLEALKVETLVFSLHSKNLTGKDFESKKEKEGNIFQTVGTSELDALEKKIPAGSIRTCVATSNYKTRFTIADEGMALQKVIDDQYLLAEGLEHFSECFFGTFFADRTDQFSGVCATVYQAYQNYPKAVKADENGIHVMLVPADTGNIVLESGMAREQRFQLHFHEPGETLTEINNRSIIYQMPDRPTIDSSVFAEAEVMPDIFVKNINYDIEAELIAKCDSHARCFGMLNWGDVPDPGYTAQGRGHGKLIWTNNEYDYPHACVLLYAKTGIRRFLDYALVAGSHWKDVDVCHYSQNPLHIGGQWAHTHNHVKEGSIVCSHEWVEGLLDCYHFTGDDSYLATAIGIGENVVRLLETPMYQKNGELGARETGWALRTLVALYCETGDIKWVRKSEWIIGQFKEWKNTYGNWLSTYMDNVLIRVPFMISVAVGSLMRFYKEFPNEELKRMILDAIDDVVENCLFDNGFFYYKEIPSLNRLGNNPLVLELLTIGYQLTGDTSYLKHGRKTFEYNLRNSFDYIVFDKRIVEDAVITGVKGTKEFAQSFLPMAVYYKAASDHHMI